MYEDSLYTLGSEIEETPASVLVKGLIDQSQIEPSWEDQSKETEDKVSNARERQLTFKGKSYKTEILHRNRATQYTALSKEIKKAHHLLDQDANLRELERQRDVLDAQKEQFNEAHQAYHDLLESFDDSNASYHWFDTRDREYQLCRMRICEKIHALERESPKEPSIISSRSKTTTSKSTNSSRLSTSSAHSRKIRAVAKAPRLEAQMQFLDKEAELKKLKLLKELEMAKAERDAMKAVEDKENIKVSSLPSDVKVLSKDELYGNTTPSKPKKSQLYLFPKTEPSHNLSIETPPFEPGVQMEPPTEHLPNPFSYTPPNPSHPPIKIEVTPSEPKIPQLQVKTEQPTDHFLNPFSYLPSEPFCPPAKTEFASGTPLNPVAPPLSYPQQVLYAPNPSEVALQEIVKLQVKQTELSSLIAEQQRISSLPVQEPPTFGGSFFDYPIFMRAFETIIEGRVSADKERLYFLNKYTTGKANDVIKGFVTLNSNDSYKRAKKLLAQRFGDPHRVSNA